MNEKFSSMNSFKYDILAKELNWNTFLDWTMTGCKPESKLTPVSGAAVDMMPRMSRNGLYGLSIVKVACMFSFQSYV